MKLRRLLRRCSPAPALLVVVAALALPAAAHADAVGEAQALFDQGIADLKAQRYDAACKELAASLEKHKDSGTKGALAVCLTKLGKTASAWQLWRDLADTAPQAQLRTDAAAKAAALEPTLPRYLVTLAGPPPAGLVVTVNGEPIVLGVSVPLPVDPGAIAVTAKAPDHDDWAQSFDAVAGKTTAIDVPALVAHPPAPHLGNPGGGEVPIVVDDSKQANRRKLAFVLGGVGAVGVLTGGIFATIAHSEWSDAQTECNNHVAACPGGMFVQATKDFNAAHTSALTSDVFFAIGGAALAGAVITWFTAPPVVDGGGLPRAGSVAEWRRGSVEHAAPAAHPMTLVPAVSPHGAGFALSGAW